MPIGAAIAGGATSAVLGSALGGGSKKSDGKPREFTLSNPFFQAHLDRRKGPDFMQLGATGALGDLQAQLFGNAGLFGGMATDNPAADFAGQQGMNLLNQASGFGVDGRFAGGSLFDPGGAFSGFNPFQHAGFSPMDVAQQQFGLLNPLLQDQFDENNLAAENRLFAQGRLGSTSGSNQFNAQLDAQDALDLDEEYTRDAHDYDTLAYRHYA